MTTASWEGLGRWAAKCDAIVDNTKAEIRTEMAKAADSLVAEMRRAAPVRHGTLRDAIKWTWGQPDEPTRFAETVEAGEFTITVYISGGSRSIDADAYYAHFQEFGTVKMAANPFFFPAWRKLRRRIRARLTRAFRRAIESA